MRNFKIRTTLGIVPSFAASRAREKEHKATFYITRGASACLVFDLLDRLGLDDKIYTWEQVEYLSFKIQQPSGDEELWEYDKNKQHFDEETQRWISEYEQIAENKHKYFKRYYEHDPKAIRKYDQIVLPLSAEYTTGLELTSRFALTQFEVKVIIDGDDNTVEPGLHESFTVIYPQPQIAVIDSLYSENKSEYSYLGE